MLQLKDNVTLHVEAGATLLLIQDNAQFPRGRRPMLFAENAVNVAITGRSTLDGLAQYEFVPMRGVDSEITREIEVARGAGVDMRRSFVESRPQLPTPKAPRGTPGVGSWGLASLALPALILSSLSRP